MTTPSWVEHRHTLIADLKTGRMREFGLRTVEAETGFVIEQFVRTREGFYRSNEWAFPTHLLSESELQDIITSFTKTFIEEMITARGVQLVLPT
jgi:hypothetical protein